MKQVLLKDPKTAQAVKERQVTPAMIRAVTYDLLREELGRCCGISKEEAGLAIGISWIVLLMRMVLDIYLWCLTGLISGFAMMDMFQKC